MFGQRIFVNDHAAAGALALAYVSRTLYAHNEIWFAERVTAAVWKRACRLTPTAAQDAIILRKAVAGPHDMRADAIVARNWLIEPLKRERNSREKFATPHIHI